MNINKCEGKIAVEGGKIFYKIYNKNAKNLPLLIVHGGPGTPHDYLVNLVEQLKEYPVIFYDQLGCGESDYSEDENLWRIERFVDEIKCIREFLKLEKFNLLGHSCGSMIAFDYMLTAHPGVEKLILASPVLSITQHLHDMQRLLKNFPVEIQHSIQQGEKDKDFSKTEYKKALKILFDQHFCRLNPWPEIFMTSAKKGKSAKKAMWGDSEFSVSGNLKNYERLHRAQEIKVPTLITCGRYDVTTPEACERYKTYFPNAKLVIFEESSHLPHLEEPEKYGAMLRDFLE